MILLFPIPSKWRFRLMIDCILCRSNPFLPVIPGFMTYQSLTLLPQECSVLWLDCFLRLLGLQIFQQFPYGQPRSYLPLHQWGGYLRWIRHWILMTNSEPSAMAFSHQRQSLQLAVNTISPKLLTWRNCQSNLWEQGHTESFIPWVYPTAWRNHLLKRQAGFLQNFFLREDPSAQRRLWYQKERWVICTLQR